MNNPTLVTGFWDIGRSSIPGQWSRQTEEYLKSLEKIINTRHNIILFGPPMFENIFKNKVPNLFFVKKDLMYFVHKRWWSQSQDLINNFKNRNDWVKYSILYYSKFYIPVINSKVDLLHEASLWNPFQSEEMYWIDAGISRYEDVSKICLKNLNNNKIACNTLPFKGDDVHALEWNKFCQLCSVDPQQNVRIFKGGFFGGNIDRIEELFYRFNFTLDKIIGEGNLTTEESILSIVKYNNENLFKDYTKDEKFCIRNIFES